MMRYIKKIKKMSMFEKNDLHVNTTRFVSFNQIRIKAIGPKRTQRSLTLAIMSASVTKLTLIGAPSNS